MYNLYLERNNPGDSRIAFALTEEQPMVDQMVPDFSQKEAAIVIKKYDRKHAMAPILFDRIVTLEIPEPISASIRVNGHGSDEHQVFGLSFFRVSLARTEICQVVQADAIDVERSARNSRSTVIRAGSHVVQRLILVSSHRLGIVRVGRLSH